VPKKKNIFTLYLQKVTGWFVQEESIWGGHDACSVLDPRAFCPDVE